MKPPRKILVLLIVLGLPGLVWFLPLQGQVIITPGTDTLALVFPQIRLETHGTGMTILITDNEAWANVGLGISGDLVRPETWQENPGGTVTWRWDIPARVPNGTLFFYHSCQTGCIERAQFAVGSNSTSPVAASRTTKLCVVSANPERDWHGQSGWDVQLGYATLANEKATGIDDLARHVYQSERQGLRVLVRIDYAPGQTLPPANDSVALGVYLDYVRRLARDQRFHSVYGYIVGSGFNDKGSNSLAPNAPVTPEWYARVFSGYGEATARTDNVLQVIRQENPQAQVLVGPVRPFKTDQDGERTYRINVPWLNYMNTLVALVDQTAREKSEAGFALSAPDGFAVNAPGRTNAVELKGRPAENEPQFDLRRAEWHGAQAGFRVYQDWLEIINAYSTTRGLPIYINSTNTFTPDEGIAPAQNYPRGWLTTAYDVIRTEPQVQALCWFLDKDESADGRWDAFSLTKGVGHLYDAANEFDELLKNNPN